MMTSAFLSTLSFSAEKNCAPNSGAKRRDDINSLIMTNPVPDEQLEGVWVSARHRDRRMRRNCRARTGPPALRLRFFRSCWSPSGLVRFANGFGRGRGCAPSGEMREVAKRREAAEQAEPAALATGAVTLGPP